MPALTMKPIDQLAADLKIQSDHIEQYGRDKAKIQLDAIESAHSRRKPGKLILVSAITPTPAGEGKTTTSIGLAQGLRRIGENAILALRQPSMRWSLSPRTFRRHQPAIYRRFSRHHRCK